MSSTEFLTSSPGPEVSRRHRQGRGRRAAAPVSLAGTVGLAAASFTVHTIIDASLGPSRGSAIGSLNQAAGDVIGIPQSIGKPFAKFGGAASGVLALGLDLDEIGDAKAIVRGLQDKIRRVQKLCAEAAKTAASDAKKLTALHKAWQAALKSAEGKANKHKSQKAQREKFLKEFKKRR